jgi:uncharacterized protein YfaS (alpha-2-macroglobulin family)
VYRAPGSSTVTPLFEVFTLTPEMAANHTITFTAPDKLSTYVVRAIVATASSLVVTSATANVTIAATTVSLTPTVPRILRVSDNATAGVIVSFTGSGASAFPLAVDIHASAVATSGAGATLMPLGPTATADGFVTARVMLKSLTDSQEVRFPLLAAEQVGVTEVRFKATAKGMGIVDAVAVQVATVPLQEAITQGGSLKLAGGATVSQGLTLSPTVPGAHQRCL